MTVPVAKAPASSIARCENVGCTKNGTKKCSRCQLVFYCGEGCQKADWQKHKVTCVSTKSSTSSEKPQNAPVPPAAQPSSAASAASSSIFNLEGFQEWAQSCIASSSPDALKSARLAAAGGKIDEAVTFISLMTPADRQTFFDEMANSPLWRGVDVAVCLFKNERQKEAMQMAKGFSPPDIEIFTQAVMTPELTKKFWGRYDKIIRV